MHELSLPAVVNVVLEEAVSTLGACFACVHRLEEDLRELRLLGHRNLPQDVAAAVARLPHDGRSLASRAAASRHIETARRDDVEHDVDRETLVRTGCECIVAIPLLAQDRLLGVLCLAPPNGQPFGAEERIALTTCADIFAFAIFNAAMSEGERLREEWASLVTHDLRQPVNVILTYVAMLDRALSNPDPHRLRKWLDQTRKAAQRLNRMIGDLADASTIEARRLSLQPRLVDLQPLAAEVVERQQTAAPDRAIVLRSAGALPPVRADPQRVEQVLDNLISNALKYSPPGGEARVELRANGADVVVTVSNRGPGIAADELPKIFSRYYRTPSARAGASGGLGLGLYIAKGLVEAQGGRIWAESQPGKTTCFRFTLPVAGARAPGD